MSITSVLCHGILSVLIAPVLALPLQAQRALPSTPVEQAGATAGIADAGSNQPSSSNRLIPFSGALPNEPDGAVTITFAIYPDQQSTSILWTESQIVQVTGGKFTVLLGSTSSTGLPAGLFTADAAHWLGVQVNGSEHRYLLVSVPYAMKAVEADRLGGLLPSDFVTVAQLAEILKNSAAGGAGTTGQQPATGSGNFRIQAAAAGTTPQPATDFTDNNTSEVLLVTQQGTGYAIHAITSGQQETILAENDAFNGTGLRAIAGFPSGVGIGLMAETASPQGIAAQFNSRAGGKILSLLGNGAEVVNVDAQGNITTTASVNASTVNAQFFMGNGGGLLNVPPSAVGAQFANSPGAIVQRDGNGDFSAGQISALNFIGNGFGLTNIPPSSVGATFANSPGAIVQRDGNGNFSAGQISALNFIGNGLGLINIPPSAVGATFANSPGAIVQRDGNGDFAANQISALNFIGNGLGLINIPPSAVGATFANSPGAIVQRDGNGSFAANQISASALNLSGNADFTSAASTAPVKAVLSSNTPLSCVASKELLIKTDAPAGQQLFICNATGNGYVLVGDGTAAGVTGLTAGDGSVAVGGTAAQPTIAVASGGITSDKLAPNAVTSVSIADGTLSPAKIVGTAATLGANTFAGIQTMPAVNAGTVVASGNISASTVSSSGGATFGGSTTVNTASGTALTVNGGDSANPGLTALNLAPQGIALQATSSGNTGVGVLGRATGGQSVAGLFVNAQGNGRIISAGVGAGTFGSEVFSVDTEGNVFAGGAQVAQFSNSPSGTTPAGLAKIDASGLAVSTAPGDTTGAVGIVVSNAGTFGPVRIAYGGTAFCVFDSLPIIQDYVQISRTTAGQCSDVGPSYPASGQVIGRVTGVAGGTGGFVLLSGPSTQALKSGVLSINTGAGLTGGPITSSGTISIADAGVTNSMLQNNSITVADGIGIGGGGTVPLGGIVTLTNLGALSFNGRVGDIVPTLGDYSFSQITGTASVSQMPPTVALTNQSNTFTANQTINGSLTTNGLLAAGNSTPFSSVASIFDQSGAGNQPAFSASSSNNPAALFLSNAPTILTVGTSTHGVLSVNNTGMEVTGSLAATSFSGDGSGLANITASKIGTLSQSDIATNTALNAETSARQTADTALQSNIAAEATARQSDVASLQTSINNVSAADAKLAASNTFTAGTQDFSGAGATLPVRSVLSANTPANCIAGKELLIKTDAPAGQQLFICDAGGTSWNLVGDGASGGVTAFNGRNGSVSPATGDYSFNQIAGTAAASQLPASTVYNNQANTFSASQTISGTVTANLFSGNGSGLSNVNATALSGLPAIAFAQLNTVNTYTAEQVLTASSAASPSLNMPAGTAPATPLAGDIWNNGGVIQYRDNVSTTRSLVTTTQNGGMQMLKIVAAITPGTIGNQSCTEQNFSVPGVSTGDVLLAVLQPGNSSPGTNIAIGGWRISANNTVAIQFCNVSRNGSTPVAGAYTFAIMR